MYGYYGMDWTYILVLIGAALCMLASAKVNSAYRLRISVPGSDCRL